MVFAELPGEDTELNNIFSRLLELENQVNNQQQVSDLSVGTGRTSLESFGALNTGLSTLFTLAPLDQEITKLLSPAGEIPAAHTNAIVSHPTDDPLNLFFLESPINDGQIKFLHPETGKDLILKTGGHFTNTADITIPDGTFTLMLWNVESGDKWLTLAGDNLGNHIATKDINFATFDGINIDRLRFVSDSAAPASADDPSIYLDGVSNMVYNIADQKQWFWTNSNETIMQLNREGVNNDTVLTVETNALDASAVPRIDIFRDDPSPANDDEFGKLRFIGTDSALASQVYSQIAVEYENVTAGRIASSMIFATSFDTGATTQFKPFMIINSANDERIRMVEDVEIVQDLILQSGLDTSKLFFDGGGDTYFTGSASSGRINVVNDNVNTMFFGTDRFELTSDRNLILNTGFVRMGERADPTAGVNEGMFYVKDVAGISRPFFVGDGLAAVDLTTGGGSQTPWTTNIDADNFLLQDFRGIEFRNANQSSLLSTIPYIHFDDPNLLINVPTGDGLLVTINGSQKFGIGASIINMFTNVNMNSNDITSIDDLIFSGAGSLLNMSGGDITGFDVLQANGSGSTLNMLGGAIDMGDGDLVDVADITIKTGSRILSAQLAEIGIQVDNAAANIGTLGLLAIPSGSLPGSKTKANMDAALGDHEGAMGWDTGLLLRLWVRNVNGNWYGFDFDASVTS